MGLSATDLFDEAIQNSQVWLNELGARPRDGEAARARGVRVLDEEAFARLIR